MKPEVEKLSSNSTYRGKLQIMCEGAKNLTYETKSKVNSHYNGFKFQYDG
jgi:hypothetical protein